MPTQEIMFYALVFLITFVVVRIVMKIRRGY